MALRERMHLDTPAEYSSSVVVLEVGVGYLHTAVSAQSSALRRVTPKAYQKHTHPADSVITETPLSSNSHLDSHIATSRPTGKSITTTHTPNPQNRRHLYTALQSNHRRGTLVHIRRVGYPSTTCRSHPTEPAAPRLRCSG
jgi:hypothetical protein